MISLEQAHQEISKLQPLEPVLLSLDNALGRVCAEDMYALASCPSIDSSLKDGFAVVASEIDNASESSPVKLAVVGALVAGDDPHTLLVQKGEAVRIMTGAPVPAGATSIVASEFTEATGDNVVVKANAKAGRNILSKGSDVSCGQLVAKKGTVLRPAHLGFLSSAGVGSLLCFPSVKVTITAIGSELVWPGENITPGKVAASNMVTAKAELKRLGITASTHIVRDDLSGLESQIGNIVREVDLLITCGGVLDGDKDLTMTTMERLGMEKIFHRVRIGPGKGACLGRIGSTVVCNLPGGPPSNHVALMLLALPACRRIMGFRSPFPMLRKVRVKQDLVGQRDWTQLFYSKIEYESDSLVATSLYDLGRLAAMGASNGLVMLPEECKEIKNGNHANAWILSSNDIL